MLPLQYTPVSALSDAERDEIWTFFSGYVRRERRVFDARLAVVEEVFRVRAADGRLVGFGAIDTITGDCTGGPYSVIVTHWSALDASIRRQQVVQRVGLRCFLRFRARHPLRPVYWLFGASTWRSYMLLPRNFPEFWPRRGAQLAERERVIVDDVMRTLGEESWDVQAGVIRRHGSSRYKEGLISMSPEVVRDPDIHFYHQRNPGQDDGDTLVCLCPLSLGNWRAFAWNAMRRRMHRPPSRASV